MSRGRHSQGGGPSGYVVLLLLGLGLLAIAAYVLAIR